MLHNFHKYQISSNTKGSRKLSPTANYYDSSNNQGNFATTITNKVSTVAEDDLLDGIINTKNEDTIRRLYRDIYYHDSIAGSAVDLMSNMPFSDFSLSGVNNPDILKYYVKSIESMKVKTLLPSLSVDYLVMGAFIGTLNFDKEKKIFTSIMPHPIDDCKFTEFPIYGLDPLIELQLNEEYTNLYKYKDKSIHLHKIYESLPESFQVAMSKKGSKLILDSGSTLYIPRRSFSTANLGSSFFERLLPIFILEKALLKGTIESSQRRLRSILHIQAGSENWIPTTDQLSSLSSMFLEADSDPISAVVATRDGIETNEVRAGGDFWKYDDIYDFASGAKLRSLGISESFLTGDATYNNMEVALSVFIEQLRSFRDLVTREFFYEKLFPNLAVANGFKKESTEPAYGVVDDSKSSKEEIKGNPHNSKIIWGNDKCTRILKDHNGNYRAVCSGDLNHDAVEVEDITEYEIPRVNWHKQLKPEADRDYMDLLEALQEKGVPIPMRMMISSAGQDVDDILNSQQDDLELRKSFKNYNQDIEKIEEDEEEAAIEDNRQMDAKEAMDHIRKALHQSQLSKVGIGNRKYGEEFDPYLRDKYGKRKSLSSAKKREINERTNRIIAAVLTDKDNKERKIEENQYKETHNDRIRVDQTTNLNSEEKTKATFIDPNAFGVTNKES